MNWGEEGGSPGPALGSAYEFCLSEVSVGEPALVSCECYLGKFGVISVVLPQRSNRFSEYLPYAWGASLLLLSVTWPEGPLSHLYSERGCGDL